MKISKQLEKQMMGLQKEIDQRKLEAEADTKAAYGLLLWLVHQHEDEMGIPIYHDRDFVQNYDRIAERYAEMSDNGGKQQ